MGGKATKVIRANNDSGSASVRANAVREEVAAASELSTLSEQYYPAVVLISWRESLENTEKKGFSVLSIPLTENNEKYEMSASTFQSKVDGFFRETLAGGAEADGLHVAALVIDEKSPPELCEAHTAFMQRKSSDAFYSKFFEAMQSYTRSYLEGQYFSIQVNVNTSGNTPVLYTQDEKRSDKNEFQHRVMGDIYESLYSQLVVNKPKAPSEGAATASGSPDNTAASSAPSQLRVVAAPASSIFAPAANFTAAAAQTNSQVGGGFGSVAGLLPQITLPLHPQAYDDLELIRKIRVKLSLDLKNIIQKDVTTLAVDEACVQWTADWSAVKRKQEAGESCWAEKDRSRASYQRYQKCKQAAEAFERAMTERCKLDLDALRQLEDVIRMQGASGCQYNVDIISLLKTKGLEAFIPKESTAPASNDDNNAAAPSATALLRCMVGGAGAASLGNATSSNANLGDARLELSVRAASPR